MASWWTSEEHGADIGLSLIVHTLCKLNGAQQFCSCMVHGHNIWMPD